MNCQNNKHKEIAGAEWLIRNSLCKKAFNIYSRLISPVCNVLERDIRP